MLTVLGGLAEFERELIKTRTSDGRARAKARGVQFGRPSKLTAYQRQETLKRLQEVALCSLPRWQYATGCRRAMLPARWSKPKDLPSAIR